MSTLERQIDEMSTSGVRHRSFFCRKNEEFKTLGAYPSLWEHMDRMLVSHSVIVTYYNISILMKEYGVCKKNANSI